jgi:hypothetical protein
MRRHARRLIRPSYDALAPSQVSADDARALSALEAFALEPRLQNHIQRHEQQSWIGYEFQSIDHDPAKNTNAALNF